MTTSASVPSVRPPEEAPPAGALPEVLIRWIVSLAAHAPSVYDVPPWRFVSDGQQLKLIADSARRLDVPDPDGRLQLLACGAALFHVRLALLRLGRTPTVHLLPDENRTELIATLDVGRPGTASMRSAEWKLLEAVRHRQKQWLLPSVPPRREPLDPLASAAEGEHAHFARIALHDGFDGRGLDLDVAVVWTDEDTRFAQLAAGQALARVLLTAAADGLDAALVRQPLDLPAHRVLLRQRSGVPGAVQAVLRLDRRPAAAPLPRRPGDEELRPEPEDLRTSLSRERLGS